MNHNILNKITENYIQNRINDAIREEDSKIYAYHFIGGNCEIIKADSEDAAFLKIFNLYGNEFIARAISCIVEENEDVQKYVENLGYTIDDVCEGALYDGNNLTLDDPVFDKIKIEFLRNYGSFTITKYNH